MIFFDISDTSIEATQLATSFVTGEALRAFSRVELKEGLIKSGEIKDQEALKKAIAGLIEKAHPKAMKDQECALTLPDSRVYTSRLNLPQRQNSQTVFDLVKAQVEKSIPQPIEELIYRFESLGKGKGPGEILLVAIPTVIVNSYVEFFNQLSLQPRLIVPESFAIHSFLAPVIGAEETVLYLDVGEKTSTATLMNKEGVVEAFTEPVERDKLLDQTKKLLSFSRERFLKDVKRIILGGGGSLKMDSDKMKAELKVEIEAAEGALKGFKLPIRVDFGTTPRVLFINTFGLALLSKTKQPLNLLP